MNNVNKLLLKLTIFSSLIPFQNAENQKNIVVIVADDMGINDVSYRGSNQIITPNIDALAYHGLILDRFYTPSMCTPSRSAAMTGKYPHHNGMQHWVILNDEPWGLPLDEKIMPQYLKEAGYKTHLIGKWHLGFFRKEYTPMRRGFDSFFGYLGSHIDYYDYKSTIKGKNITRGRDLRRNFEQDYAKYDEKYATDLFTSEAIRVIKNHDKSKPMYLQLNHLAPHAGNENHALQIKVKDIFGFKHITDKRRRNFAAMMKSLDRSVGKVVKALKSANILNETIIVFYSDNGGATSLIHSTTASNYPLKGQKHTAWEGGIRTNAIIYAPFLPSSVINRDLFYVADILPTITSLASANVRIDRKIDGIDLSKLLVSKIPNKDIPKRKEMISIDDVIGYGSYIFGDYKLVNGTYASGVFDAWLGSNNNSDINEGFYVPRVLNSTVSKILNAFNPLSESKIREMREGLRIKCLGVKKACNLQKSPCLFDIIRDPCEERNIANEKPSIFEFMKKSYFKHLKDVVPSRRISKSDPRADPINFNGTWNWWVQ